MKIDISQERRDNPSLWDSLLSSFELEFLHYSSFEELPDEASVNEYKEKELKDIFNADSENQEKLDKDLQNKAHALLEESKIQEAWKTLLANR